jgi:YbgC/YbaW family acyl-CoA thioester hydrolase
VIEQVERIRVGWVDTDAGGRIHFTAVFRWVEAAETALMRRLELMEGWENFPRRHVEADYLKVLVFEDEVEVRLRVDRVGETSITYRWDLVKDADAYVSGTHTVVHVDEEGRPTPLPQQLRAQLDGRA